MPIVRFFETMTIDSACQFCITEEKRERAGCADCIIRLHVDNASVWRVHYNISMYTTHTR